MTYRKTFYVMLKQECSANKNGVGTHTKMAISKQLQTHFKAKPEKGVGTPIPPHYTLVHNLLYLSKCFLSNKTYCIHAT